MPQSLSKVLVHLIFSTKHRQPLIAEPIQPRLHAYIVGILDHLKSPSLQTGGVSDHVHILCVLSRTISQAELLEQIKKSSSKWMKAEGGIPEFGWQAGYGSGGEIDRLYSKPGAAPSHDEFPGGVPEISGALQDCL